MCISILQNFSPKKKKKASYRTIKKKKASMFQSIKKKYNNIPCKI